MQIDTYMLIARSTDTEDYGAALTVSDTNIHDVPIEWSVVQWDTDGETTYHHTYHASIVEASIEYMDRCLTMGINPLSRVESIDTLTTRADTLRPHYPTVRQMALSQRDLDGLIEDE